MARSRKARRREERPLPAIIGERVRTLRDARAVSRRGLAQQSGVALTALVLLERGEAEPGRQPRLSTLQRVARALDVRVADLLDEEPPPPRPDAATTLFYRLVEHLRERQRDQRYLRAVERLIHAADLLVEHEPVVDQVASLGRPRSRR